MRLFFLSRSAAGAGRAPAGGAWLWLWLLMLLGGTAAAVAAPSLPPPPPRHFNDFAGVVSPAVAGELDRQLAQFERDTSSQVVVAVYESLPEGAVLEEYAAEVFKHWGVGLKNQNNGVLLLVFVRDRVLRVEVGYGLEGAIPD